MVGTLTGAIGYFYLGSPRNNFKSHHFGVQWVKGHGDIALKLYTGMLNSSKTVESRFLKLLGFVVPVLLDLDY